MTRQIAIDRLTWVALQRLFSRLGRDGFRELAEARKVVMCKQVGGRLAGSPPEWEGLEIEWTFSGDRNQPLEEAAAQLRVSYESGLELEEAWFTETEKISALERYLRRLHPYVHRVS